MRGLLIILLFLLFASPFDAHPGRTAADGCHYCRTNCDQWGVAWNERHCHGGNAPDQAQVPVQQPIQQANVVAPTLAPAYTAVPTRTIYRPPTPTVTPIPTKYVETEFDKKKLFRVVSVIDGDTLDVAIRGKVERVRLLGIDTPETKDPRKPVQCFGVEATNKLTSLVTGKYVKLVDDRTQGNRDKHGRLLRYVYDGKVFINAEMVKQGYVFSFKEYPTKYLKDFNALERQAREKNVGLWSKCQR